MTKEESSLISLRTWVRSVENINKTGFREGASNGQSATFQSSFNTGYKQGLHFGIQLGIHEAIIGCPGQTQENFNTLSDTRKINCQLCINKNSEELIDSLINAQEEKNREYLRKKE
ncbi:hypothetical protein evm_005286 [Chilo suppressalis]|nr:hypothetical protein evm_005286 [Chilo suppressalis]